MSEEKPIQNHEYDGIQEFDNPLPNWWLVTFFGTIIFAFLYWIHYMFGGGPSIAQELAKNMKAIQAVKKAGPQYSEDKLAVLFTEESRNKGKAVFVDKCAVCHGQKGEGLIGPNLTDNAWLHGQGHRSDIYKTVSEGVLDKGMPAWGEQLNENEVVNVVAFVYSLKGTNVPGGKPPQGSEYP